jgi:hypothetical protein
LIISFKTKELRQACSSLLAAEKLLGRADAQRLIAVLSDIEAMETADELLQIFGAITRIAVDNSIELAVGAHHRATFVAAGVRFRVGVDGVPDWTTVRRLKLTDLARWL